MCGPSATSCSASRITRPFTRVSCCVTCGSRAVRVRTSGIELAMFVRIVKVTPRFSGFLSINEYEIEADRHDGGTQRVTRLVMERGHAVGVLAYDPARDEVVLVNEIRPGQVADGVQAFSDALVAGVIDPGEDP